eukprot:Opistho-2@5630
MALRTSSAASIMFLLKLNTSTIWALPSLAVARTSLTPEMLCSDFSMRLMISRSVVSGEAPGYGMLTTMTGCSTSGIWLTRSFLRASRPRHIRPMMMTIVATGFLTLKLERNISASGGLGRRLRRLRCGRRRRSGLAQLDLATILQGAGGMAQHLVPLFQAGSDDLQAQALVARAELDGHLAERAVLHAPGEGLVALALDGGIGQHQGADTLALHAAFGIEAGHARLLGAGEVHQHLDLARGRVGGHGDAAHLALEVGLRIAVDLEEHRLADLQFRHAVGRDQAFEAHAGRVDDLDQLLADLGRVAGRDLAVTQHAVKGGAHLG